MPKISTRQLNIEIKQLKAQVNHLGNYLAESNSLVQTQDGEIGRLTELNSTLLRIIDRLTAKEEARAQPSSTPVQ